MFARDSNVVIAVAVSAAAPPKQGTILAATGVPDNRVATATLVVSRGEGFEEVTEEVGVVRVRLGIIMLRGGAQAGSWCLARVLKLSGALIEVGSRVGYRRGRGRARDHEVLGEQRVARLPARVPGVATEVLGAECVDRALVDGVGGVGGVVDVGEREHGGLLRGAAGAGHASALRARHSIRGVFNSRHG
jgi:hypothetical protein